MRDGMATRRTVCDEDIAASALLLEATTLINISHQTQNPSGVWRLTRVRDNLVFRASPTYWHS